MFIRSVKCSAFVSSRSLSSVLVIVAGFYDARTLL